MDVEGRAIVHRSAGLVEDYPGSKVIRPEHAEQRVVVDAREPPTWIPVCGDKDVVIGAVGIRARYSSERYCQAWQHG